MQSRSVFLTSVLPAAIFGAAYASIFSWIGWKGPSITGSKIPMAVSLGAGFLLPLVQHHILHLFYERNLVKEKELLLRRMLGSHSYLREKEGASSLLQKLNVDFPSFAEEKFYSQGDIASGLAQLGILTLAVGMLAPYLLVGVVCALLVGLVLSAIFRRISSVYFECRREAETNVFYAEKDFVDGQEYLQVNPSFHGLIGKILHFSKSSLQLDRKVGAIQDAQIALSGGLKFLAVAALSTVILLPFSINPENFYWLYLFLGAGGIISMGLQRKHSTQIYAAKCKDFFGAPILMDKREIGGAGIEAQSLVVSFDREKFSADLGPIFLSWGATDRILVKGESGKGKTTLLRALLGLHSFWNGQIRVGEGAIAYVPQEPFFLDSGTLEENLAVDSESMERAKRLLNELNLQNLNLPNGFKTVLGSKGVSPSKGQRKRIAVVREILRDPKIMILDEPLAGLDSASGAQLIRAIRSHAPNCLLVVAEHRDEILNFLEPTQTLNLDSRRISLCPSSTAAMATS